MLLALAVVPEGCGRFVDARFGDAELLLLTCVGRGIDPGAECCGGRAAAASGGDRGVEVVLTRSTAAGPSN
jgi:hypothetical protein